MANVTYTVKSGDTLSGIAKKYGTTVNALVALNNIANADRIYPGEVLIISSDGSSGSTNSSVSTVNRAVIDKVDLVAGTDRETYARWSWSKHDQTDHYEVYWYYSWGVGVVVDSTVNVTQRSSTFTSGSQATHVSVKVKPIAKTYKDSKGNDVAYFVADWSTKTEKSTYYFSNNPPKAPSVPSVKIEDYTLTATVTDLEEVSKLATHVQFHVYQDNGHLFADSGHIPIVTYQASYSTTVDPGHEYKVQVRSWRDGAYSEWSGFSGNENTKPSATSIKTCRANSTTSVYLTWDPVDNADSYDIEYTTKREYFDGSNKTQTQSGIDSTSYLLTGVESGSEYFFRVRAVNNKGESAWSDIVSLILGKKPAAPTTWSSTTTAVIGEPLNLYWVHNSEDGSKQKQAELELDVNGTITVHTIDNPTFGDDEAEEKTSTYSFNTSGLSDGVKLQWRVRTCGVTGEFGDWSIQRTVDIYAPASLSLNVVDLNGNRLEDLTSFPFTVYGHGGPNSQKPIGYYLSIISQESYETVDVIGNKTFVNSGDAVYAKHFDISEDLTVTISANDVDLENNVQYKVNCVVTMDSGLSAEAESYFTVAWSDEVYEPSTEIGIHEDTYSAVIRPYCYDENGELVDNITLSVYRRQYDGSFVEVATGLHNTRATFVVDPHPALDYARYRIVAISNTTGAVSYYDVPGYPVGGTSVILQWNEEWSNFDVTDDAVESYTYAGSTLKLPYNIDVSPGYNMDVALVEYIGRKHPVTYYGTQIGETATWNTSIPKSDKDTLYALRRLAIWPGDVYVREPSGSGYWASINVSFSTKHLDVTIPVTLNITRVEGGL